MSEARSQNIIINPMNQLGYNVSEDGVCEGFTDTFIQFALDGRLANFIALINLIHKTPHFTDKIKDFKRDLQKRISDADIRGLIRKEQIQFLKLSAEEQNFVEVLNLFEVITTFQHPNRKGLRKTSSLQEISKLVESKSLKKKGGLKEIYVDEMIFTTSEWCNYLEELRVIMEQEQSDKDPLIFYFELRLEFSEPKKKLIIQHIVGLHYDHRKKYWMFIDANLLPNVPFLCANLEEKDSHLLDIDAAQFKTMLPGAIRNGAAIYGMKLLYFKDEKYIPVRAKLCTTGKNPRLKEIRKKLETLKYSQLSYCALHEFSVRQTISKCGLLYLAARNNDTVKISQLIESKADLTIVNNRGETALHCAAQYGSKEIIQILVKPEYKMNLNQFMTDGVNNTSAVFAAQQDHGECLKILADAGANLNLLGEKSGSAPIHYAAGANAIKAMQVLVQPEYKVLLDQTTDEGQTALIIAAEKNHIQIMKLLFDKGASALITDKKGYTALHMAAQEGSVDAVDFLIKEYKVNMNQALPLPDGRTAVHIAAKKNHLNILLSLAANNANMQIVDYNQLTAMHYAAAHGSINVVQQLLKYNIPVLQKDNIDHSALYYAISQKHYEITLLLFLNVNTHQLNVEEKQLISDEKNQLLAVLSKESSFISRENVNVLRKMIHLISNSKVVSHPEVISSQKERSLLLSRRKIITYGAAAAMFGLFCFTVSAGVKSNLNESLFKLKY